MGLVDQDWIVLEVSLDILHREVFFRTTGRQFLNWELMRLDRATKVLVFYLQERLAILIEWSVTLFFIGGCIDSC